MKPPASIVNFLAAPSRVANSLDWRKASGTVLSMRISKNEVELALATHPSFHEPVMQLPSIPIERTIINNKKVIDNKIAKEISNTIRKFHVCGMIVDWPVKGEGWCGEECGTTLNVLEQLTDQNVFHESRPICLYDPTNSHLKEDEWGRTPIYSRPSTKTRNLESTTTFRGNNKNEEHFILNVWNTFCKTYWPDISPYEENYRDIQNSFSDSDEDLSSIRSERYASATTTF